MWHETTHVYSTVDLRGTPAAGRRAALFGRLYPGAVPNPARQCARRTTRPDCPAVQLRHAECAPCHPCLPPPRAGLVVCPILGSQADPRRARCQTVVGPAARTAALVWQTPQHLDLALGGG